MGGRVCHVQEKQGEEGVSMPYTRKTKMYYPKKGSAEAKAWGREMAVLKKVKKRKRR